MTNMSQLKLYPGIIYNLDFMYSLDILLFHQMFRGEGVFVKNMRLHCESVVMDYY